MPKQFTRECRLQTKQASDAHMSVDAEMKDVVWVTSCFFACGHQTEMQDVAELIVHSGNLLAGWA